MCEPILLLVTVRRWWRFTAQSLGIPSACVRNTSDGISRTVEVIGAIVTSPRNSTAESRVRITPGCFLSGLPKRTSEPRPASVGPYLLRLPKPELVRFDRVAFITQAVLSLRLLRPQMRESLTERPPGEARACRTESLGRRIHSRDKFFVQDHMNRLHPNPP